MSSHAKTERAAKTKATKAIKSLAESSKRHVKEEDKVSVLVIQKQENHVLSDDEDNLDVLQCEQFASECKKELDDNG